MAEEYLRVRVKDTGHEITIRANEFDADVYEKADKKNALGPDGLPAPPKHRTTVDKSAAANRAAGSRQAQTEES